MIQTFGNWTSSFEICGKTYRVGLLRADSHNHVKPLNPNCTALPFFAYGLFKPGQLGFERLEPHVADCRMRCVVDGTLWLRDGIPLFESATGDRTSGALIYFRGEDSLVAYKRVSY